MSEEKNTEKKGRKGSERKIVFKKENVSHDRNYVKIGWNEKKGENKPGIKLRKRWENRKETKGKRKVTMPRN